MAHLEKAVNSLEIDPTLDPIGSTAGILSSNVTLGDSDRIRAATSLLNTFNFAIQVQAKRTDWTPQDFTAFSIALSAMDKISPIA